MERIGLYGGTFNPIHFGHLRTAWEIKEVFALKKVVFIPAALPPHKQPKHLENAQDRLEMIRLAISSQPDFSISDIELQRSGPSYTIDTIHHFKSADYRDTQLFFIIGSDAFLEINTWKSYKDLLTQIPFIVMVRPDMVTNDINHQLEKINQFLVSKISPRYVFNPRESRYDHPEIRPIYVHQVTPLNISSTKIREIIKTGKSIQFLVPGDVLKYIENKGLYK